MGSVLVFLFSMFLLSCPRQKTSTDHLDQVESPSFSKVIAVKSDVDHKDKKTSLSKSSQETYEILRFCGTVENEVFKIIDKRYKNTDKVPSQLNILSQLLSPLKKQNIFYDCLKIDTQESTEGLSTVYNVFRTCEKNPRLIAKIEKKSNLEMNVSFVQSTWSYVIGESALLNLKDKVCYIHLKENVVSRFSCENSLMTMNTGDHLEEIRIHKYEFDRNGKNQIMVKGGRFKNMVEVSQISIQVPDQGRIKLIEKELKIRDDFKTD